MPKIRFVVNLPDDKVHLLIVEEDNPRLDVTVCGESPGGMEQTWADLVEDRADLYPVPGSLVCLKCFPNLAQFIEEIILIPGLNVPRA